MAVVFLLSAAAIFARGQDPSNLSLRGRLAIVEPAARRIAVLPDGEAHLVEMMVDNDGEVRYEDRQLTLSELVLLVGQRVSIRYRIESDLRVAHDIIVDPEG
jgi:hypothetical protein